MVEDGSDSQSIQACSIIDCVILVSLNVHQENVISKCCFFYINYFDSQTN